MIARFAEWTDNTDEKCLKNDQNRPVKNKKRPENNANLFEEITL